MLELIYWILIILVAIFLLIGAIYNVINEIQSSKEHKKRMEYLDKQIKFLENMEREEK